MGHNTFNWQQLATFAAGCGSLILSVPSSAAAQTETESGASVVEEIVVTGTRREETQFEVPMSISVISAKTLQEQQVKTFNDFATQVANLSFNYGESTAANDRGVAIRGIQGGDTTGYYLDDLPMPISLNPRVLDIQRIEVLRGPQGSLYGARSMGGTIRMITATPSLSEYSGNISAQGLTIDGAGDGYEASGTFNIPLITDRLAVRVTPFVGKDAGYIDRVISPPTNPADRTLTKDTASNEYEGILASALWQPNDDLTIRPSVMYQNSDADGRPLADYTASNRTNIRQYDVHEKMTDEWLYAGLNISYAAGIGDITSTTSYLDRESFTREDVSEFTSFAFGTDPVLSDITTDYTTEILTEELRFTSKWDGPLQLIGGLWYQRTETVSHVAQIVPEYTALFGSPDLFRNYLPTVAKSKAAFGELTYTFNDQWSATIGARYSEDDAETGGFVYGVVQGPLTPEDATSNATKQSDSVVTPKILVKYKPTDEVVIFAQAAKGYRPGDGQVPPPADFCASTYAEYGLSPESLSSYGPDSLWSYELGTKWQSPDRRYSLSGSVFYIDWTDIRVTLGFPDCGFSATINSAKAVSRGAELEFSARPLDALTLTAAVGYDDAEIKDPGERVTIPPAGSPIQHVAPWTGSFGAAYRHQFNAGVEGALRTDYTFTDASYSTTNSPTDPRRRPSYSLVNLRASLTTGALEYALFVKNLTNAHPNLGDQLSQAAELPDRPRWAVGAPRTYGVSVRWEF
jgi:iron complex outermembrane recepter protein